MVAVGQAGLVPVGLAGPVSEDGGVALAGDGGVGAHLRYHVLALLVGGCVVHHLRVAGAPLLLVALLLLHRLAHLLRHLAHHRAALRHADGGALLLRDHLVGDLAARRRVSRPGVPEPPAVAVPQGGLGGGLGLGLRGGQGGGGQEEGEQVARAHSSSTSHTGRDQELKWILRWWVLLYTSSLPPIPPLPTW